MILSSWNIYLLAWALVILSFFLAIVGLMYNVLFIISYSSAILAIVLGITSEIMARRET